MLLDFFSTSFTYLMLLIILVNLQQRRYKNAQKKRTATLLFAVWYMVMFTVMVLREGLGYPEFIDWCILALGIVALVIWRKKFFPFKLRCKTCGEKLGFHAWLGNDANQCAECYFKEHPEDRPGTAPACEIPTDEIMKAREAKARKVDEIDWDSWEPDERCVLCYVTDKENNRILLIHKKRGLGTGLINGPGGHIELEETAREAAVRETKEETGYDVSDLEERGILHFQFTDGLSMIGYVFFTSSFSGTMLDETDETKPFWCDRDKIDYDMMWKDDSIWLEKALNGDKFQGWFIFDGQNLLDSKVDFNEEDTDEQ